MPSAPAIAISKDGRAPVRAPSSQVRQLPLPPRSPDESPIRENFFLKSPRTMHPITTIESRTVVLPSTDIDTDQIIPARFLTTTTRAGLGKHAFNDWRYDAHGQPKADFFLNQPPARGCEILVAGR